MKRFFKRKKSISAFVECPSCRASVAKAFINSHLDTCLSSATPKRRKISEEFTSSNISSSSSSSSSGSSVSGDKTGANPSTTATPKKWSFLSADRKKASSPSSSDLYPIRAVEDENLSGLFLVPNFISEDEEEAVLGFLDSGEGEQPPYSWRLHDNKNRRTGPHFSKQWGVKTDFLRRRFLKPDRPIPHILRPIIERMRCIKEGRAFRPNEANAIDYRRKEGHFLGAHCDDRHLSGQILANLCLAGDCIMRYVRDGAKNSSVGSFRGGAALKNAYDVHLPRRALQLQTGTVRYDFQHSIPNELLLSDRRVSITFRENKDEALGEHV